MTKLILVGFNLLILFAYKIFFGGDVLVVQEMQPNIKPGDSTIVELIITKGDREGFAKWQQVLPKGFVASSVETNGATFSFKNQSIKIIWMALPQTETFSIKYKIEVSPDVQGDFNLTGKFSFIEENERKDVMSETFILTVNENAISQEVVDTTEPIEGADTMISIIADSMQMANENEEPVIDTDDAMEDLTEEEKEEEEESDDIENNVAPEESAIKTTATETDDVTIEREIKYLDKGNYEVMLTINKGDLNSFGKVEEYLPPEYTASASNSSNGMFSFEKNVMKILWMALPKEETINVSYKLKSNSDDLDSATVHGVFSYLNEDQSEQVTMHPTLFKNTTAVEDEQLAEEPEEKIEPEEEEILPPVEEPVTEEELVKEITNVPSPETSVTYKVQIAAARKEVTQQYFIDRHNITENVSIEFHESWYKYTVGSYKIYKAARDKRNNVWAERNKINDAFVTAYNAGERISVQEALMISNQKWFK